MGPAEDASHGSGGDARLTDAARSVNLKRRSVRDSLASLLDSMVELKNYDRETLLMRLESFVLASRPQRAEVERLLNEYRRLTAQKQVSREELDAARKALLDYVCPEEVP